MKYIFITFIFLFSIPFKGISQRINLQELVNQKKFAEVVAMAGKLTSSDSLNVSVMSAVGQAYEGLLKYREAYNCYEHCLSLDTTNMNILGSVARTASAIGRVSEAERYFFKVLDLDSLDFYANYQLARLYYQLGDYDKAISRYDRLQEVDTSNPVIWQNKGDCYTRKMSFPTAATCYYRGFQLNRENAGLASSLINTLYMLGDNNVNDGLAICDTALSYNPTSRLLRQNMGMGLFLTKKYSEADSVYSTLLAEGDSSFITLKYSGASRYHHGLFMNAIGPLEKAYEQDTCDVDVCLLLGSALGKTYDRKKAYELLNTAEKNMRPKPFLVNRLLLYRAETHTKDGNKDAAARLYYQIYKLNPEKVDILRTAMWLYYAQSVDKFRSEEERQRFLFLLVYYTKAKIEQGGKDEFDGVRLWLKNFYEYMFFQGVKELSTLAPDGKKGKVTTAEIMSILEALPAPKEVSPVGAIVSE